MQHTRIGISLFLLALGWPAMSGAAGSLVVGLPGDLKSAIPAGTTDDNTLTIQQHVYEGLVTWKANGEVAPMLAKELPEVSQDGLTYTFTLRDNIKFHDGTPLTPEAVVGSWKYLLNNTSGWGCRQYFNGTGSVNVTSIEPIGTDKVVFKLEEPSPELLTQMARADCGESAIMAPSVYGEPKSAKPIGTGPFKVESVQNGNRVVLVKFADYQPRSEPSDGYAGSKQAQLDKLTFLIVPDPAALFAGLQSGDIQLWPEVGLKYVGPLKEREGIIVKSVGSPSINSFPMQTARGPLKDPALRRAINRAVDRPGMIDAVSYGFGEPSFSPIPYGSPFYQAAEKSGFEPDPSVLAKLIQASPPSEPIVITTNKNFSNMYDAAVILQASLQSAGLDARLDVLDFASQLQKYYSGEYQIMTWDYAPMLDSALLLDRITGSKDKIPSKVWDNPKARDLVDTLLHAPASERQPIVDQIHALYLEDAPLVVWSSGSVTDAWSDKIQGYEPWPGRKPRLWNVSVKP